MSDNTSTRPEPADSAPADTFFSVDVETSSTTPTTGALLTVGIVPVVHDGTAWKLFDGDWLYIRIDCGEQPFPEPDHYTSMPWWREQASEVRAEAYEDRTLRRHRPAVAAQTIAQYVESIEPACSRRYFAANPVSFDKPWIDKLFADHTMPSPFHYRSLCLRSMKFGMNPTRRFGNDRDGHISAIPHHALYDAVAQAHDLVDMLQNKARPSTHT